MSDTDRTLIDETERIVALDDKPVLRNLLISQAYHDLSDGMADLLGKDNAVWVTVASWSSRSVGRFIRSEEIPGLLDNALQQSSRLQTGLKLLGDGLRRVHPSLDLDPFEHLAGSAQRVIAVAANYLTLGNKIVFAELGTIFARFVRAFAGDKSRDQSKLDAFLAELREGPPEPDEVTGDPTVLATLKSSERGGQTLLRNSMANYYQAMFTADAKERAELVLLANAQGGLHEQTRLQPYIAGSLNAASNDLLYSSSHDAFAQRLADKALLGTLRSVLDRLLKPLSAEFEKIFREIATSEMMKLKLPDRELRLGRDVPAAPGQPLYAPALEQIENPELRSVLRQYGVLEQDSDKRGLLAQATQAAQGLLGDFGISAERAFGSRARDWADLTQRMRYIFQLFRARQKDRNLFGQPFSAAQRRAILDGEIPGGPLY